MPLVPHLAQAVRAACADWQGDVIFVSEQEEKRALFDGATAALVASGTATLELGLARLPMVVGYKTDPLLGYFVSRVCAVPSVVLANLILDRPIVSEFLQARCTAENLAEAVAPILFDAQCNRAMRDALAPIGEIMETGAKAPAERAAEIILGLS